VSLDLEIMDISKKFKKRFTHYYKSTLLSFKFYHSVNRFGVTSVNN
jgi:hypothetical protein